MVVTSAKFEAPPLTHIFTAVYEDGTTFTQPHDDRPRTPRPDGSGSAFTDVQLDRVIAFMLESGVGDDDPDKHLYLVDLRDGHFEIDGAMFAIGGMGGTDPMPAGYRRELVYFRRVAHDRTSRAMTGMVLEQQTRRCYHLGYRVLDAAGVECGQHTIEFGHELFKHQM